jgi:hypothetical protein
LEELFESFEVYVANTTWNEDGEKARSIASKIVFLAESFENRLGARP